MPTKHAGRTARGLIDGSTCFPGVSRRLIAQLVWAGVVIPLAVAAPSAQALGLGAAQATSSLGEALRVRIPVTLDSVEEASCINVAPASDDLPFPAGPKSRVVSSGTSTFIEILTTQAEVDPAIGFKVTVGCASPVSRDYVVFLDPPANQSQRPTTLPATSTIGAAVPAASAVARRADVADGNAEPQAPRASRRNRPAKQHPGTPPPSGEVTPLTTDAVPAAKDQPPAALRHAPPSQRAVKGKTFEQGSSPVGAQDRFRISDDVDNPSLHLSSDLGEPTFSAEPQRLRELKAERDRLMAVLAGEAVPQPASEAQLANQRQLENQISHLNGDVQALHQQVASLTTQNQTLQQAGRPSMVTWIMAAIAAASLVGAGLLALRYRRQRQYADGQPWWEQTQMAAASDEEPVFRPRSQDVEDERPAMPIVQDLGNSLSISEFSPERRKAALSQTTVSLQRVVDRSALAREIAVGGATAAAVKALNPSASEGDGVPLDLGETRSQPTPTVTETSASATDADHPLKHDTVAYETVHREDLTRTIDQLVSNDAPVQMLDFNLDLPSSAIRPAPTTGPYEGHDLPPLNFSPTLAEPMMSPMGPDTILRLDQGVDGESGSDEAEETVSLHFKLVQFSSVVDQVIELDKANDPLKAIALLRQYVLRDETIPTIMWLMLFGLYRKVGKQPVYEALAEHFSRRYKRPMIAWDSSLEDRAPQVNLAAQPELDARLKAHWGTPAGLEMLRELTCGRDQPDEVVFNAVAQIELLGLTKVFPLNEG